MLSATPEKRDDLRRLYTLISYLEDGETKGSGVAVENNAMKALEEVGTPQRHVFSRSSSRLEHCWKIG